MIAPFQEALKANTGFSKENLPQKTEIDVVELGNYIFNVTSEKKAKSPQLKTLYNIDEKVVNYTTNCRRNIVI